MCERNGCETCRIGINWLNRVRKNGHRDPYIAIRAMFTSNTGGGAQDFLQKNCPGEDPMQKRAQKSQLVSN